MKAREKSKKCSECHSSEIYNGRRWYRYEHLYSTTGYPVCNSCHIRLNMFEFLKYGLGLPLSQEHHGKLKLKELVELAETMLGAAKIQFSNNRPEMSKEESREILGIFLGAILEKKTNPGFDFPKSVSKSLTEWFNAAGIMKSRKNNRPCFEN